MNGKRLQDRSDNLTCVTSGESQLKYQIQPGDDFSKKNALTVQGTATKVVKETADKETLN